jgi:hypothetical protein
MRKVTAVEDLIRWKDDSNRIASDHAARAAKRSAELVSGGGPRLLDLLHSVFDVFMASALRSVDGDWALDE